MSMDHDLSLGFTPRKSVTVKRKDAMSLLEARLATHWGRDRGAHLRPSRESLAGRIAVWRYWQRASSEIIGERIRDVGIDVVLHAEL